MQQSTANPLAASMANVAPPPPPGAGAGRPISIRGKKTIDAQNADKDVKFDYCMVFKVIPEYLEKAGSAAHAGKPVELKEAIGEASYKQIVEKIVHNGFSVRAFFSVQGDEVLVLLGASLDKLRMDADNVDYKLLLDEAALKMDGVSFNNFTDPETGMMVNLTDRVKRTHVIPEKSAQTELRPYQYLYAPYDSQEEYTKLFACQQGMTHPFRESVRLKLIYQVLTRAESAGGVGLPMRKFLLPGKNHLMDAFFPLHNHESIRRLGATWASGCSWRQPIDDVRDYFGEKIALYYAFMGHYIAWLMPLAIVGLGVQLHVASVTSPNAISVPFFGLVMAFWACLLLEFWKRKEKRLAKEWGMIGYEEREEDRPEYVEQALALSGSEEKHPVSGKPIYFIPDELRNNRVCESVSIVLSFITLVIGTVVAIYILRYFLQNGGLKNTTPEEAASTASTIASILNTVQITVYGSCYELILEPITTRECPRTDTEFQDSLIAKSFVFQFVNSYASFIYVAFIQPFVEPIEAPPLDTLAVNLAIVFATKLFVGNITELVVPRLNAANRMKENTKGVDPDKFTAVEKEYILVPYDIVKNLMTDYSNVAIQFGFLTLFAVALPAAPTLAFVSNFINVRMSATKMLHYVQRPIPTGAEDIGTWFSIFEVLSIMAVVSNSALVCFTSTFFHMLSWTARVWLFICFQYFVFAVLFAFKAGVEDVPEEVTIQVERQEFVTRTVFEGAMEEDDAALLARMQTLAEANAHRVPKVHPHGELKNAVGVSTGLSPLAMERAINMFKAAN